MNFKNIMKKLTVVAMALVVVLGMTACGSKSESKSEAKTYKVGMEATFPPFDTTNKNGDLDGFDVDMLNAIAEDQGFKVEWKNMGFDGLIPALESGNIDIIASGMWASADREKEVDFTNTYYDSGLVVAVKADDNTIKSEKDLTNDMKVGAQIGTSGASLIEKWAKEGKIKEAKIYDKVNEAVMDLQNGTIAALVNDKPVTTAYMAQQKDKIKIVGKTLNEEKYGMAVKSGNKELLDKINDGLKNIQKSGKFDELLKKWKLK